jgi:hypothetical protein
MKFAKQLLNNLKNTVKRTITSDSIKQHEDMICGITMITFCYVLLGYNVYNYDEVKKGR